MIEVSIILPTYNERDNVPLIVEAIANSLVGYSFEVLVVDDNSPDLTWELCQELSEEYNFLHSIRRMENKGLSASVMEGFASARGLYFIVMDADLQHDPSVLPKFIDQFRSGADLVVGTRNDDGGKVEEWTWLRKFVSWVATKMAHFLLALESTDPMSGFFGIKREFFEEKHKEINPKGFKILLEFLARAQNKNMKEVGYQFKPRQIGESKLSSGVIFDYLIGLYELGWGKVLPIRFIKYGLVALTGVVVNQGSLMIFSEGFDLDLSLSLKLAIELSIISNYTINNLWTFKDAQFKGLNKYLMGLLYFNCICIAGAYINYSVTFYSMNHIVENVYIANFIGIFLAALWNYIINSKVTWKVN